MLLAKLRLGAPVGDLVAGIRLDTSPTDTRTLHAEDGVSDLQSPSALLRFQSSTTKRGMAPQPASPQ